MRCLSFNDDWMFGKEKIPTTKVDLPHDAMIVEPRDPTSPGGSAVAYFPPGYYIYEKTFAVPTDWKNQHIILQFEGIYKNSKIYVNGKEAGGRPYGYIPFFVNLDSLLSYGADNTIRVEVDNSNMPNSRWYTGAGIYRPVWLWIGEKNYIKPEGIKITTLSYSPARIHVNVDHVGGDAVIEIYDAENLVASGSGSSVELEISAAKLWNSETPNLYTCMVSLCENGKEVDKAYETFGIRMVEWSAQGLMINGNSTLLRGACVHHDNGILGARCFDKSEERRVRLLKTHGFNAIRSSHNPASKAMLRACDELGVFMIDETWDMWCGHKNKYDYATDFMDCFKEDIRAMVNRDYNHPSVIMYSIGNEMADPHNEKGVALGKEMVDLIHQLDSSRAVTCGTNLMIMLLASNGRGIYKEEGGLSIAEKPKKNITKKKQKASGSLLFNMITSVIGSGMNRMANSKKADTITSPFLDSLDIAGYNYASGRYPLEGKAHPDRVVFGSETFPPDIAKNWAMVEKYPYLIGDFMWTGWDYLGEAGIGAWSYDSDGSAFNKPYPWLLADTGVLDILGNPGGQVYHAAAVWGLFDQPAIAVRPVNRPGVRPSKSIWRGTNAIPSWSWKNCEGNQAIVEVYSSASVIELIQNGKYLGRKKTKQCKAVFKTSYSSGTLTAVAYDITGKQVGRSDISSATGQTKIAVTPEQDFIKQDEIAYIAINLVGENNIIESNADTMLHVEVSGGEFLAFGSANPRTEESYNSGCFTTYYGQSLAVVRATKKGVLRISVSGENLPESTAQIIVE